ncbi:MAG: envelope stress sensor histidine kinase CpxA, partial [Vibrio sp.]
AKKDHEITHKKGPKYVLLTDLNGNWVKPPKDPYGRAFNNFATQNLALDNPQQRLYGRLMVLGPFKVTAANKPLLMYVGYRWNRPPPLLIQLFDRPIRLLLAVMLVSTPLLLWLAWALSQPAMRLEKAARKVANGQFEVDPTLETKGTSEFRQAGESFNQMVLALNNMISGQQRLLSDISHELRSPLTRLRMANALATRKQGESNELKRIDTEAERLEQMIAELLNLSRLYVDSHQEQEVISSAELWQDLLEDAAFEAEQMDKQFHYNALVKANLHGNPNLLTSAVENVVRNAIKYSQDEIWFSSQLDHQHIKLTIEDNGDGVDKTEMDAIFRPFYRVSTARDRDSGGAGLGLAITENAIRQHNGSIKAFASTHGGLGIEIKLPIVRKRQAKS